MNLLFQGLSCITPISFQTINSIKILSCYHIQTKRMTTPIENNQHVQVKQYLLDPPIGHY
jgi:hypothetical protein